MSHAEAGAKLVYQRRRNHKVIREGQRIIDLRRRDPSQEWRTRGARSEALLLRDDDAAVLVAVPDKDGMFSAEVLIQTHVALRTVDRNLIVANEVVENCTRRTVVGQRIDQIHQPLRIRVQLAGRDDIAWIAR